MSKELNITFSKSVKVSGGLALMLYAKKGVLSSAASEVDPDGIIGKAADIAGFSGKSLATLDIVAPAGSEADRIGLLGIGEIDKIKAQDWLKLGGVAFAEFRKSNKVTVFADMADLQTTPEDLANLALGMVLRAYSFDTYKTK